jgi:hypothetical protein
MIVQLMKNERRMDWTLWPAFIYNSQSLTPQGKDAVLWARDVLQRTLGDKFFQEIEKRSIQHPMFSLDLWPANDVPKAYANLFQLAAQIELLQSRVGWAKVRNELLTDLRLDRWVSTLLQLEVAGLGLRDEWQIELERPLSNGGTTDVTLTKTATKLIVEAKAMLLSGNEQEASEYFYQMVQTLMALAWKYKVRITGSIGSPLSPDHQAQWLNEIERAAEKAARTGKPQTMLGPVSGQLEIIEETGMPGVAPLEGVLIETDVGKRLVDKLFKTNKQYENAGPAWVRLGDYAGLWQSSSLQGKTLSEKLDILTPFLQQVLAILPNLSGVILSPEVWPTAHPLSNSKIEPGTREGSIAVSCPIPGENRSKETIIITQAGKFTEQARIFADLYASESTWLNWALHQLGEPLFDELVRLSE